MKVELDLRWNLGVDPAQPLDESLFELLAGIQETGSLQKACRRAGVSYRHAWVCSRRQRRHWASRSPS
jgi:molybdenum-dependent DNA-binding transcriptional regulator ModE